MKTIKKTAPKSVTIRKTNGGIETVDAKAYLKALNPSIDFDTPIPTEPTPEGKQIKLVLKNPVTGVAKKSPILKNPDGLMSYNQANAIKWRIKSLTGTTITWEEIKHIPKGQASELIGQKDDSKFIHSMNVLLS